MGKGPQFRYNNRMEKKKGDMDANMDGESRSIKRVVGSTLGHRLCFMLRK